LPALGSPSGTAHEVFTRWEFVPDRLPLGGEPKVVATGVDSRPALVPFWRTDARPVGTPLF
ncbi:MAG: hypothetical protein NUV81_04210, partial [bacterium]|nr:hypothetical protein [bacterium]